MECEKERIDRVENEAGKNETAEVLGDDRLHPVGVLLDARWLKNRLANSNHPRKHVDW